MKIQLLHVRDPDSACWTRVFIDGVEVFGVEEVDVDAGAGWTADEWAQCIRDTEAVAPSALRDATLQVLRDPPGSQYISDVGV